MSQSNATSTSSDGPIKPKTRRRHRPKKKTQDTGEAETGSSEGKINKRRPLKKESTDEPAKNTSKDTSKDTTRGDGSAKSGVKHEHKHKNGSKKAKDPRKDYRYQQIKKLIKEFKPVTINGTPIRTICKQVQEEDETTAIDTYLVNLVKNQPNQSIYLSFLIIPSDPDFPFDLDCLKVSLCVPSGYPIKPVLPSIYVLNDEIPRGFAANIETGFKDIAALAVTGMPSESIDIQLVDGKGLLSQVSTLDKYLEALLKQEKKRTIKFVGKPKERETKREKASKSPTPTTPKSQSPSVPVQVIDDDKRNELISQLTQKLKSNIKLFNKSKFATKFKVWLPINNSEDIPMSWVNNGKLEVIISIPADYPNNYPTISIPNRFLEVMGEGRHQSTNLCENFKSFEFEDKSIVSILNYVANNLSTFCCEPFEFKNYFNVVKKFNQL